VFTALLFVTGCAATHPGASRRGDAVGLHCRNDWKAYLNENFTRGETRSEVEKKLANKYLEKIELPFNSGSSYAMVYRVNDKTELYFEFNVEDDTLRKCLSIGPTIWIRNPDNGKAFHVLDRKSRQMY
jgi:hypothetical protein